MKSHKPLNPDHPVLKDLLGRYPDFLSQNVDSAHYRYHNAIAGVLNTLKHDTKIVSLIGVLSRPLHIWRYQEQPQSYSIHYTSNLTNIKRVALYQEGNENDRLVKEESFKQGIKLYNNYLEFKCDETIPTNRFYVEVETHDGFIFQKGFPENDTPQNDIYDHDSALDMMGRLYNLPRREYRTGLQEKDYPHTTPQFCNSSTEWDYYYELRLIQHINSIGETALHILAFKNIFEITPQVEGRWRQVARMEQDNMEPLEKAKYMASENWNSNVYDVTYNLADLPKNIKIPSAWDIANLIDETFPIGAKVFFNINEESHLETKLNFSDNITLTLKIEDKIKIKDTNEVKEIGKDAGY